MPLYEYECAGCGKRFELIQKFSDPPTATCLACGGTAERLLSPPAIQFKGTGWYVTDYARKPAEAGKSAPTERSDDKGEGGAKGDSKAKEAAPASKSEEKKRELQS
jgi:putative FmdB family regulatory protein